ncbi:gamma-glutamyl-gamma-aminobutyrate hydrolase family protein [Aurantimicrobium sp. MWH-Uga1]|uniref:gamma-glutamyl-gamma-aminobutyrate hydrolase family protein n=1 Tax=Aurantimicrobium sp. MWH-Uga1 TaxID=2079575 RepID=UPI000DEDBB01|nr:gamma-glutamyl-gamma-aminobutyrate hydrolase family protein [Aurantimicrobium sp. MWH-Uga1]AXE55085.1 Putative glutamine amidotransferase [Aurantimicrobium sp. MWH-Uga1]
MARPRIAILARFAESTSATRYAAIVTARRLAEMVWAAGGEPLSMLPVSESDWADRLRGIDGVLMPGGADINPRTYGQEISSEHVYDVDDLADEADISLVKYALQTSMPFFAICRGLQITNVALGGTLVQHMEQPHQHHVAPVTIDKYLDELGLSTTSLQASCYHHQMIDQVAPGLEVIGRSTEGYVEAVKIDAPGWAFGVQWHPEDNYDTDSAQLEILARFIAEASAYAARN